MKAEHLVSMANQIADFYVSESGETAAAADVARHITRFWDPRMRRQIIEHALGGGAGLCPAALAAVGQLKPPAVPVSA